MAEASAENCSELLVNAVLPAGDALASHNIAHGFDLFKIKGLNGSHMCFVYPVLGPNVRFGPNEIPPEHGKTLREMCHQVVRATDYIQHHGVCHGGVYPSNRLSSTELTETP